MQFSPTFQLIEKIKQIGLVVILLYLVISQISGPSQVLAAVADPNSQTAPTPSETTDTGFNIFDAPNSETLQALNPLVLADSPFAEEFSSPAGIINRTLKFLFPLVGLILFLMLVWGGFDILMNAHNSKGLEKGRQRITAALIGFFLLFSSFWIIQIIEYIFNLAIL